MIFKSANLEIKSTTGDLCGYASVFGTLDAHQDLVLPGAFQKSLKMWQTQGSFPCMLWQHNAASLIGTWTQMKETSCGLWVEGKLSLDHAIGREAYDLLKAGIVDRLSIGFRVVKSSCLSDIRLLEELDLVEVSLVTFGANPKACVVSYKSVTTQMTRLAKDLGREVCFP